MNKFNVKALEIKNDKSPFFTNFNIEEDYAYVGHYVDTNLSNIREGLMSYKRRHIYDFQMSDHVFVKYEGDFTHMFKVKIFHYLLVFKPYKTILVLLQHTVFK